MDDGILALLLDAIKNISAGKLDNELIIQSDNEIINSITASLNKLAADIKEISEVAEDLASGNLDGIVPGRRNYLSAPLKKLQSRLSVLTWNAQQIEKNKVVSRIEYDGELYCTFNRLMDMIAQQSLGSLQEVGADSYNSWKYHQILLALNSINLMVFEVNHDGKIVYQNEQAKELFSGTDSLKDICDADDNYELISYLAEMFRDSVTSRREEIFDNTRKAWFRIVSDKVSFPSGQEFFMYVIDDITHWKTQEIMLEKKANIDVLTGVYNKRGGLELLRRQMQSFDENSVHSLLFIDLDGLKNVNDTYGHKEGDFFIKSVAGLLEDSARQSDIVMRFGGDEFVVFLPKCSNENAKKKQSEMYTQLLEINNKSNKPYTIGFSCGLESFSFNNNIDISSIIESADAKMYEDKKMKKSGR